MRFGVQHSVGDPAWKPEILAPNAVADFARVAERRGFDLIAFTDHPAPSATWVDSGGEGVADPFSSLGFCAAVTNHIRLLTFVLVPSYRNPFLAAHQLATLDALSGGRLVVGLGTGYLFGEFRALGADPADRLRAFDEGVALMRRAWSGETVSIETSEFVGRATKVLPPVVQRPHPPFWIHGNSPFGLRRAAQYGAGWLGMMTHDDVMVRTTRTTPLPDTAVLSRRIDEVRATATAAGRDPGQVEIVVAGAWPMLDVRTNRATDLYIEEVAELQSLGVDWVLSTVCGDDPGAACETLERFGEDVVQTVRSG
jgi:probable F420-dependent oxidoreductase